MIPFSLQRDIGGKLSRHLGVILYTLISPLSPWISILNLPCQRKKPTFYSNVPLSWFVSLAFSEKLSDTPTIKKEKKSGGSILKGTCD